VASQQKARLQVGHTVGTCRILPECSNAHASSAPTVRPQAMLLVTWWLFRALSTTLRKLGRSSSSSSQDSHGNSHGKPAPSRTVQNSKVQNKPPTRRDVRRCLAGSRLGILAGYSHGRNHSWEVPLRHMMEDIPIRFTNMPSSKEVGKQYFRVTNDFYLVQLTMMKGGRSCNNTSQTD